MPAVIVVAASSRVGGASRASMLILPPNATALPALHLTARCTLDFVPQGYAWFTGFRVGPRLGRSSPRHRTFAVGLRDGQHGDRVPVHKERPRTRVRVWVRVCVCPRRAEVQWYEDVMINVLGFAELLGTRTQGEGGSAIPPHHNVR
jgi:hypothetical protein